MTTMEDFEERIKKLEEICLPQTGFKDKVMGDILAPILSLVSNQIKTKMEIEERHLTREIEAKMEMAAKNLIKDIKEQIKGMRATLDLEDFMEKIRVMQTMLHILDSRLHHIETLLKREKI